MGHAKKNYLYEVIQILTGLLYCGLEMSDEKISTASFRLLVLSSVSFIRIFVNKYVNLLKFELDLKCLIMPKTYLVFEWVKPF